MAEFDFASVLAQKQRELDARAEEERVAKLSLADQIGRGERAVSTGLNNSIGATLGAIPDAIGWGMRTIGIPGSPRPGAYTEAAQTALNAVGDYVGGGRFKPANATERGLYAAGHGVGDALSIAVPAAGVARATRATAPIVSGVADTLAANPTMQSVAGATGQVVEQATDSPTLGLAASMAVPFSAGAIRGVVSPGLSQLNREQQRLAQLLQSEGVTLTPGQQSGSRVLRGLESTMDTLPGTSGNQNLIRQAQRQQYNRAVLERAGIFGETSATPDVINRGLDDAGQRMADIYSRNNFDINATSLNAVAAVAQNVRRYLPESLQRPILNRIEDFTNKIRPGAAPGSYIVEGPAFASLDSELSRHMRTSDNAQVREALRELRTALRTGMDGSISGQDAAALAEARQHYAVGKQIQETMNAPTRDAVAGDISPAQLARVAASGPGNNFAAGRGDLRDLAAGGKEFVRDNIPNSGTPERNMWMRLLTGSAAGGMGGGYVGLDPVKSALLGAVALGGPAVVQGAYNSGLGRRYLTNQAAAALPPFAARTGIGAAAATQLPSLLDDLRAPDQLRLKVQ